MNLTPRLDAVARMIEINTVIADIGTDHGYIPVHLVSKGICPKAIACDVNKGPLDSARSFIRANNLSGKIETRLGSGLSVIKVGEVQAAVIAGMGGVLISDILTASANVVQSLKYCVLQPMVAQDVLRKWIYDNGYTIVDEDLAKEDKRIYEIIKISRGNESIKDDIYYKIGKVLIEKKHPLLQELIERKIQEQVEILESVGLVSTPGAVAKHNQTKQLIARYEEVLRWL